LKADIFQPKKQGHYPTVIMIHGGGWRSGDKSMQHAIATRLAAKGFVTVCPAYQLSQEALYPAALYNIKAAIRWVKDHAETYSIDTSKIVTSGCSAGGQLAMLVALSSGVEEMEGSYGEFHSTSNVQAVIDIDGAIDFISPLSIKSCRAGKTSSTDNEWLHGSFFDHPDIIKGVNLT
jgi:acetyl esterase/lipase